MCRKPRKMVGRDTAKWIIGQYGRWGWAVFWSRKTSLRKMRWWRLEPDYLGSARNCLRRWSTLAKRPDVDEVLRQNGGMGPSFGEAGKTFPQLCSWLCDVRYEDQSPKGRVVISAERKGDRVQIKIRVADSGLMVEHYSENLSDAVIGLELLLGSNDCPWQLDPYPMDKPKPKGRKKT